MRQYIDTLQDVQGNALVGAAVLVQNFIGGGNASIFSDNGLTPIVTSTVATGADGQFNFFAADGDYNLVMSKNATVFKIQSPVSLFDGTPQITYADTGVVNAYAIANSALEKALRTGLRASFLAAHSATLPSTFQYNGLAVKNIIVPGGAIAGAGAIILGGIYSVEYDGTSWQLRNQGIANIGVTAAEASVPVVVVNPFYAPGIIDRYGTNTTPGTTDMTNAIKAAISQAQAGGASVLGLAASYLFSSNLPITGNIGFSGTDQYTTIFLKSGNFVGITVTGQPYLSDFTLDKTGADSSDGIDLNTAGRPRLQRLLVQHQGSHGINLIQCTVGNFQDISAVSNTGDGIRLTASGGVQANANTFNNIDSRGNGGWGFNVVNGRANFGMGLVLQSNTAGGIQIDTAFGNQFQVYSESNTGPSISFTANCVAPNFGGNVVDAIFLDAAPVFNGASAPVNLAITNKAGATFQTNYSQIIADTLTFSNQKGDGTGPVGVLKVTHTVNNQYDFSASSGGDALFNWANSAGVTNHASTGYVAAGKGFYPNGFGAGANPVVLSGAGAPAGVVAAPVGSLYMNSGGGAGTTLYVKESGGGGTGGWVGK